MSTVLVSLPPSVSTWSLEGQAALSMTKTTFESLDFRGKLSLLPMKVGAEESSYVIPDSPTSRASVCSNGESELSALPAIPSFPQSWSKAVTSCFQSWQSWELPSEDSHQFWSTSQPDELPESRVLLKWKEEAYGLSPSLLSLLATFPVNGSACNSVSEQLHTFLKWDQWMKKYGSEADFQQLSKFAGSEVQEQIPEAPRKVARKFPLQVESFRNSFSSLFDGSGEGASEYAAAWRVYASEGLLLHKKMDNLEKANQTPDPAEFLAYKSLTSGFLQVVALGVHNRMGRVPQAEAMEAVRPLVALASLAVATFSDLVLASQGQEHRTASLSTTQLFDEDWAASVHNAALVHFQEESEAVVISTDGSLYKSEVLELVEIVKASFHGMVLWYRTAAAFKSDCPRTPASSSPFQSVEGGLERSSAPSWAMDLVGGAVDDVVVLMCQQRAGL